jgi:uncharacterized protein (TIGR03067 family)
MMSNTNPIKWCVLAGAVAGFALVTGNVAPGILADDSTVSSALKAIQGTWVTSENDNIDAKWVFKEETLTASVHGMDYVGKVKVDDRAKPHATLDIALTEGPEDSKGKTAKAIYKLEGEKLVVSVSVPGHDRPKDFEPVPDEVYLFELKKQKKD